MTVLTMYAPNTGTLIFIKQIFLDVNPTQQQWEISAPQSPKNNNNSIQKKNNSRETSEISKTISEMDLTGIYRTLHLNTTKYLLFSAAPGFSPNEPHIMTYRKPQQIQKHLNNILYSI